MFHNSKTITIRDGYALSGYYFIFYTADTRVLYVVLYKNQDEYKKSFR